MISCETGSGNNPTTHASLVTKNRGKFMKTLLCALGVVALLVQATYVMAEELPPEGSKQLSEIAKMLEDKGYKPVTEASMENGVWEIDAYMNNEERELRVDPVTGEIISDRRD